MEAIYITYKKKRLKFMISLFELCTRHLTALIVM